MLLNIDIAIIIAFLFLNLAVGLYYGRGVTTISDYALGGRNFTTAALVSTIVATAVTGSLFTVGVSRTHSDGLFGLLPICGFAISFLILSRYFIPKMKSFLGDISIAESMGKHYGKKVQVITAICAVIETVGFIAIQYKVFGNILSYFLGMNLADTIIISGMVVTLYSAFGGIRSVTFTDVMQFMIFGTVVPLIGIVLWKTTLGIENMTVKPLFEIPAFNLYHVFDYQKREFWDMLFLFSHSVIPSSAASFQRIMMGESVTQAKKAFAISSIVILAIIVAVAWIGFLLLALQPDLSSEQLIPYIVDNYSYVGFRGLVITGIIAMSMSSSDSFINISAVFIAHDVFKPLGITIKNELKLARICAVVIGIGSIFLALSGKSLLEIILFANEFYMPIVTVPLLLTILGFRTTTKTVLNGMTAGFIAIIGWKVAGIDFNPIIPAMLINLATMLFIHHFTNQPGGWEKVDIMNAGTKASFIDSLKQFSFKEFIYNNSPKSESIYSFFGMFCFVSTISTIYLTQSELLGKHGDIMLYFYEGMLLISVFFALHMMWSSRIRHRMVVGIMWHVALIYNLTFCTSFFLLISKFHNIQMIVFTLSTMIVFTLCRWKTALVIIAVGISGGVLTYEAMFGNAQAHIENSYHILIYISLFASTALISFFKPTEEYFDETEAEVDVLKEEVTMLSSTVGNLSEEVETKEQKINSLNNDVDELNSKVGFFSERVNDHEKEIERLGATSQKILNNVTHELRLPVGNVMNFSEMLSSGLDNFSKEQLKDISDEVLQNSTRLSTMILNMLDLAMLDIQKVKLNKKIMNLGELVKERVERCRKIYLGKKPIDFKIVIHPEVLIAVDPNYMRQVVDNIIINAIKFTDKGMIEVRVTKNLDSGIIIVRDEGRGINMLEMHDLFTPFKMGIDDESKAEGRGVGLALCRSAIIAHGGHIDVKSEGIGAVFTILLPM